jgi:hypothetical protein
MQRRKHDMQQQNLTPDLTPYLTPDLTPYPEVFKNHDYHGEIKTKIGKKLGD